MEGGHPHASACPDPAELAAFVTGNLPGTAFQHVAGHVEGCRACGQALDALEDHPDPLLSGLRQAATEGVPAEEPVPPDLLAAARSCYGGRSPGGRPAQQPQRIGKFELLEELGRGSFGHVFRARDTELGRTVAIKLLRAGRLASREEVDRFLREARSAAQLTHPGLVALYETGQTDDGVCYLVEEFLEGKTLADRLRDGRFSFRRAAELIADVADALDHAHRHGIIHRDVKPSNILV